MDPHQFAAAHHGRITHQSRIAPRGSRAARRCPVRLEKSSEAICNVKRAISGYYQAIRHGNHGRRYGTDRRLIMTCYLLGHKVKHLLVNPWLREPAAAT
jgi:hypothetical protein